MTFDVTGDLIVDVSYSSAQNPEGSFCIDFWAWVNSGSSGLRSPICSRDMPPPRGYCFVVTPEGRWAFAVGFPEAQSWLKAEGPSARLNEWQRITGSYNHNDRSVSIFVDGKLTGSATASSLEP